MVAAVTLVTDPQADTSLHGGGTIDENSRTGNIAVVWPKFGNLATAMRLWISTNGGRSFRYEGNVANIVAAVPYARRHLADLDIFEREASNTSYSGPRGVRVWGEAVPALLDARSIRARDPERTSTTDWHGHRAA
jgi:hypothetical protein